MNPLVACFFRLSLIIGIVGLFFSGASGQFVQQGREFLGTYNLQQLGHSTAISEDGKTIAIGSVDHPNFVVTSGQVQIYEYHNDQWIQKGKTIYGPQTGARAGYAISLSADGNVLAVGAPEYSSFVTRGHVRIYEWNGTNWIRRGADILGLNSNDELGSAVSLNTNGDIVAVGAPNSSGIVGNSSGQVSLYEWDGTSWTQKGTYINGDAIYDGLGSAISINASGNTVVIGAAGNDGNGFGSGQIKIYEWNGTTWVQKGVDIYGDAGDRLGGAVSINDNGNIVAVGAAQNDNNGVAAGCARIYEWNGTSWLQKGTDINGVSTNGLFGSAVSLNDNADRVAIGASGAFSSDTGYVKIYEWKGTNWNQIATAIKGDAVADNTGHAVSLSKDGQTVIVGSRWDDTGDSDAGKARVYSITKVYGNVYLDLNQNCQQDSLEIGIYKRTLLINPGKLTIQTDIRGYWGVDSLPAGTYTITTDTTPTNNYQPCAPLYTFTVIQPDSITQAPAIGYKAIKQCTSPDVSIHAPILRRGFSNQIIYVQACNNTDASTIMDSAYVVVTLDSLFTVDTAALPYTSLGNSTYRINVGDILPGQCVNFWLSTTISLNAILGQSLCMQADLYPVDTCALDTLPNTNIGVPCTAPYDFSYLVIEATCINNDSIAFTITNLKDDMDCWSEVRLYIDGMLVTIDSVQLQTLQSKTFTYQGDGRTWRMEVDQHPLHPGNSQPSATIELCGNAANWTSNLVNILPLDDADPVRDIYCGLVTGSYDPNDKRGFPLGIGTDHDILPNQKLDYVIRFQNTGTDTAFTVVIRDTLSTDFDIFSVQSGASSHQYEFRMYGPRVLEWTFNNIMLPDSNVNEPASNGFVQFTVNQQPNLPNGTVLENSAGIYFDFNAPIITNTSRHTIDDGIIILDVTAPESAAMQLRVYPNPTRDWLMVELEQETGVMLSLMNQLGQVIHTQAATGARSQISLQGLPAGIYYLSVQDGKQTAVQKIIKQ